MKRRVFSPRSCSRGWFSHKSSNAAEALQWFHELAQTVGGCHELGAIERLLATIPETDRDLQLGRGRRAR